MRPRADGMTGETREMREMRRPPKPIFRDYGNIVPFLCLNIIKFVFEASARVLFLYPFYRERAENTHSREPTAGKETLC